MNDVISLDGRRLGPAPPAMRLEASLVVGCPCVGAAGPHLAVDDGTRHVGHLVCDIPVDGGVHCGGRFVALLAGDDETGYFACGRCGLLVRLLDGPRRPTYWYRQPMQVRLARRLRQRARQRTVVRLDGRRLGVTRRAPTIQADMSSGCACSPRRGPHLTVDDGDTHVGHIVCDGQVADGDCGGKFAELADRKGRSTDLFECERCATVIRHDLDAARHPSLDERAWEPCD